MNDFYWQLAEDNPEAVIYEEYEQAFLGVALKNNMTPVAVYDLRVVMGLLVEEIGTDDYVEEYLSDIEKTEEDLVSHLLESANNYIETKLLGGEETDNENYPIFLEIPMLDSRYEEE